MAGTRPGGSAARAALHIRRLIYDGRLRPGERVTQATIAEELGLSRIPVREALVGLEREGWVTLEPNRGAVVNALSTATVRDHFELYGTACALAVRRAFERGQGEELADGLQIVMRKLTKADDPREFTRLTVAFHRVVVDASGSDRIPLVIQALSELIPGSFFALVPDAIPPERRGLKKVTAAVAAGDPDAAGAAYVETMRAVGEIVLRMFEARGLVQ